ncbi:MAG: hypothetical protein U0822_06520 [Anaerolineae bacterium]
MLEVLLPALAIGMALFLGGATLTLRAVGRPGWNPAISRTAKSIWGLGYIVALVIALIWLGPAIILATWPFWLGTLLVTAIIFGLLDVSHRLGTNRSSSPTRSDISWDEMWRSYEGKPLQGWMLEAASSGRVFYDGHPARVVDGRLIPVNAAQPGGIDGLFARLDRLIGPGSK